MPGYKFKPNKSVAKRFKVSKTGKLKRWRLPWSAAWWRWS